MIVIFLTLRVTIYFVSDLHMLVINWDFHGYFSYMRMFPVRETLTNLDETLKS